jgi:lipid-binding SYLF domain-containing protein
MKVARSLLVALAGISLMAGCSTTPKTENSKADLHDSATTALNKFEREDSSLKRFLDGADGYAVFPEVGKGGLVVGGAYGRGELYEKGQFVGYTDLSQGSVGFQAGGQSYAELIVFESESALMKFKAGNYALSAQASAVALKAGAAAQANFKDGVAIFTFTNAGLMYEATVAGQKFNFESPK